MKIEKIEQLEEDIISVKIVGIENIEFNIDTKNIHTNEDLRKEIRRRIDKHNDKRNEEYYRNANLEMFKLTIGQEV
jgi:hypothetical protein